MMPSDATICRRSSSLSDNSQSLFIYKRSNTTDQVTWQEVCLNPEMVHDPLIPEEFAV